MKVDLLERDRLFWKGDKNDMYIVKENYKMIKGGNPRVVPLNLLWNSCVPPKLRFFAWEAWWGKILTMEQLKKRGFLLASRCPLCGKVEWNLNQHLVHCPRIWDLWLVLSPFQAFLGSAHTPLRTCYPAEVGSLL